MINSRAIRNRITVCREHGIPISNYGVILAYVNGITERSRMVFGL